MEGTRHEKTAIMLAAYVIGFTTAFIAFGINRLSDPANMQIETTQSTSLYTEEKGADANAEEITNIGFNKDGLFAITSGYERLLSADKSVLGANISNSVQDTPGFYYSIVDAEASRNGKFVYFCEQISADADNCDPYVYSLQDDSVHPIKLDGEAYKALIAEHESAWSESNHLVLNKMTSVDNITPWVFVTIEPEVQ